MTGKEARHELASKVIDCIAVRQSVRSKLAASRLNACGKMWCSRMEEKLHFTTFVAAGLRPNFLCFLILACHSLMRRS
jgi:hypothetical protein